MRRWCCSLLLLLACVPARADLSTLNRVLQQTPQRDGFEICHGGGCAAVERTALDEVEWAQVRAVFTPLPQSPAQERDCIATAIGVLEGLVGLKTGTATDRGGTFGNSAYPGQMDCNDEAANSTTYMKLMAQDGLIRFHDIADTTTRGFFFNGWPHTTAVLRERQRGTRHAVDSWFYDNGAPAVIVPLEQWKTGWKPDDSAAR
jgi:hypothetical protein